MGHEEDKELMMIRMETLKSMIGKLKNKTSQSSLKQYSLADEKSHLVKDKGYFERSRPVDNARPSILTGQSSPPNKNRIISKSNPTSPSSPSTSRRIVATTPSPLLKNKTKHNLSRSASISQLSPNHSANTVVITSGAISINQSPSNVSSINRSLSKVNSLSKSPMKVSESKLQLTSTPNINGQTSSNIKSSKPIVSTSHSPLRELKSVSSSSKSYSDSEISLRKNLFKQFGSSLAISQPACNPSFLSTNNGSMASSVTVPARPASTGLAEVCLVNNHTRPSSILASYSPSTHEYEPSMKTNKNTEPQKNTSAIINLQKISPAFTTVETITKPLTKFVKRPPTHTITKPITDKVTGTTITNTQLYSSTGPTITCVPFKKQGNSIGRISSSNNSSLEKPILPKPGKILFERTGKILFDRHASTPQKTFSSGPNVRDSSNELPTLNKTANFAQEFKLIRKKHATANIKTHQKATTSTKFYSSDYIPPEMCEKARTILSKYKVVRKKDLVNHTICNSMRKDINANYSQVLPPSCSPSTVDVHGKILFQRYKPPYMRGNAIGSYKSGYLKKAKGYYPPTTVNSNLYRNFVSRRIMYMRNVDPNPFSTQVKPSLHVSGLPNKQAKKEIILSRHGTNYKVAGNLKSLRRLSLNPGHKLKHTPITKPAICNGKYHLTRSNSKLTNKSGSARQYVASQVLKKTHAARKKVNKEKYCLFYNRFGKCKRGEKCHFIHDPEKIAVCTRFLRGTCKDERCLFSHKLDPDKMPECSYFLRGECGRDNCPYRHVNVGESASVCDDFLKGYCPRGKECMKKHILECEEFSNTGSCSKGESCMLTHRENSPIKRKYLGTRPPKGFRQKRRKRSKGEDETIEENNIEEVTTSPSEGKKHMLPKFISEKIKLLRESTSEKPTSFAGIKKFYESTETDKEKTVLPSSKDDLWDSDFIPLSNYSGGESDDESSEFIQRMFTFK